MLRAPVDSVMTLDLISADRLWLSSNSWSRACDVAYVKHGSKRHGTAPVLPTRIDQTAADGRAPCADSSSLDHATLDQVCSPHGCPCVRHHADWKFPNIARFGAKHNSGAATAGGRKTVRCSPQTDDVSDTE